MNIKAKLAGHYKSRFRTTAMMDDDIKNIKRLNALFAITADLTRQSSMRFLQKKNQPSKKTTMSVMTIVIMIISII